MNTYDTVATKEQPTSRTEVKHLVDEADAACRRATDWILAQQRPTGEIGDPQFGFKYHRGPWALALMGHRAEALRLCQWIRNNLYDGGRLDRDARRLTDGWAYRDSVLMIGAHMVGQYDLSLGLVESLLSWQDPLSGGFANDAIEPGIGSDEMDLPYAAGPGFALLATGRIAEARRVADFLSNMFEAQPSPDDRFYCFWSRERQCLITADDAAFQDRMVVDFDADRMQRWTFGGIAAGFLCRLYLADPTPEHLALARRYQQLSMTATPAQLRYPSACKSSWGAAMLLQVTGEDEYLRWCIQMTEWYLINQDAAGWWHPWVENSTSDIIEITLEFIQHLQLLTNTLRSTPPLAAQTAASA